MDLIDEQDIPRLQIGQDRGEITCLCQHRAGGHAEVYTQLTRHNLRERCFAQTGRAVKQRVVHRFAALTGGLDENTQIGARLGLTDEITQHLGAQGAVVIFR